ncbi:MAG: TolC family protein [Muribaculaceae bacterium]|nr:TolC family protein [Muribaculaceae bacterium]
MRKYSLLLVALLSALGVAAQKQWTLQECVDYAMEHNITLQKSRLQLQTAAEEVKGSRAALLPSLSASTNHSVGYTPWQDSGTTTVTNGTVNTKVDKGYYNGSYGLNASWTVWNGNRNRNNIKISELAERQAELSIAASANTIQERIAQLYVQILYLNEAIKVNEASLETSKRNEQRGQEMVNVGKMSKADLAQLTAQRATDEYAIVEAQSQLASYKLQLKQLLELPGTEQFDIAVPSTTDEMALAAIPPLQAVYDQALATRPEIENARLSIESSKLNIDIAKAGALPNISLSGGVSTGTNSRAANGWGTQMKSNLSTTAGVTVSIPIYDQRQTKTAVSKARLQQQQAELDLLDQQKQLYQTIEGYWLDATTNQQKFKAATANVESEEQSYYLLSEQFRIGLKNIIELMTGKDKLLSAQQNKLQSKYMTILNRQMLNFYQGETIKM